MSDFRIVLITAKPSVEAFFAAMGGRSSTVRTTTLDVGSGALALASRASRAVMVASVAIVDGSSDPVEALAVCRLLRTQREDLRIAILFCCAHAAQPESLRSFLDAGICSFLDLQLSAEQTLAALRSIARGEDVVRLHLSEASSAVLFSSQSAGERLSADELVLLRLVALGMTDQQIGAQMNLSHHTIKHRIERLRRRQNARNRIHLAALADRLERSQLAGSS